MFIESIMRENPMSVLNAVSRLLKKEEVRLNRELSAIGAAVAAFGKTYMNGTNAQSLSARGRARIGPAKRAHRAKAPKTAKIIPIKSKRTLSKAAGKKAGAGQQGRSAKTRVKKSA